MVNNSRKLGLSFSQWMAENKPHGFDVQDHRLGGLLQRMRSCMERLQDYRDGRIEAIPELEEKISPIAEGLINFNSWSQSHTTNRV